VTRSAPGILMKYEKFVLPEGCDFQSLYEQRNAPNLGEIINIAGVGYFFKEEAIFAQRHQVKPLVLKPALCVGDVAQGGALGVEVRAGLGLQLLPAQLDRRRSLLRGCRLL